MQCEVNRAEFVNATAWVARTLSARPMQPILGAVKLEVADNSLTLSGYDYDASVKAQVKAEPKSDPGVVLVPAGLLANIANGLPKKPVILETVDNTLSLKCGKASFSFQVMNSGDFPELPECPAPVGTIDGELFVDTLSQILPATSTDITRQNLTGVLIEFGDAFLTLTATDSHRLHTRVIPWTRDKFAPDGSALVPEKFLRGLLKNFAGDEVTISLSPEANAVWFTSGQRETMTNLIAKQFPSYKRIIPSEDSLPNVVFMQSVEVAEALKRTARAMTYARNYVTLRFAPGAMEITAAGDLAGGAESVETQSEVADEFTFRFNPDYLLAVLSACGDTTVKAAMSENPNKPAIFTTDDQADLRCMIMPVRA